MDRLVRVGTYWHLAEANLVKFHLESQGIRAAISGTTTNALLGEAGGNISPIEWLVAQTDEEVAKLAIEAYWNATPQYEQSQWKCNKCGELSPSSFAVCWSCGDERQSSIPYVPETGGSSTLPSLTVGSSSELDRKRESQLAISKSPYDTPSLNYEPASSKDEEETTVAVTRVVEGIERAWRAAWIGIFLLPPLLNLYSLYLLARFGLGDTPLSPKHNIKFIVAFFVNLFVIVMVLFFVLDIYTL